MHIVSKLTWNYRSERWSACEKIRWFLWCKQHLLTKLLEVLWPEINSDYQFSCWKAVLSFNKIPLSKRQSADHSGSGNWGGSGATAKPAMTGRVVVTYFPEFPGFKPIPAPDWLPGLNAQIVARAALMKRNYGHRLTSHLIKPRYRTIYLLVHFQLRT